MSVPNIVKGSLFFWDGFSQDKRQSGVLFLVTIKISLFACPLLHRSMMYALRPKIVHVL